MAFGVLLGKFSFVRRPNLFQGFSSDHVFQVFVLSPFLGFLEVLLKWLF